jgi:hypothetical protein
MVGGGQMNEVAGQDFCKTEDFVAIRNEAGKVWLNPKMNAGRGDRAV